MATKKAALEPQHRWWHNWAIKWLFNKQADLLPYPFLGPVTPCEQSEGSSVVSCEVRDALLSTWRKPPGFSYHYIKLSVPSTDVCLRRLTCFRKKTQQKNKTQGKWAQIISLLVHISTTIDQERWQRKNTAAVVIPTWVSKLNLEDKSLANLLLPPMGRLTPSHIVLPLYSKWLLHFSDHTYSLVLFEKSSLWAELTL